MCTGFWCVNLRERDHWGDPDGNGSIMLRWMENSDLHKFLVWKPEGRDHRVEPDIDGSTIL
jgi:hypothetical protein